MSTDVVTAIDLTAVDVAVLDMAGTTVADGGVVEQSFEAAMTRTGLGPGSPRHDEALDYVRETMGQSKIAVFRHLLVDETLAQQANSAFEEAYAAAVHDGAVNAMDGAEKTIAWLRDHGTKVALTTGFAATTRDLILDRLGWRDVADLVLSPSDVGRGRPYPDLNLVAMLRLGGAGVTSLLVAGDTTSDMQAAVRAGACVRIGVRSGGSRSSMLYGAGATHVLDDLSALPGLAAFT